MNLSKPSKSNYKSFGIFKNHPQLFVMNLVSFLLLCTCIFTALSSSSPLQPGVKLPPDWHQTLEGFEEDPIIEEHVGRLVTPHQITHSL
jgi:hypothetical protein